MPAPTLFTRLFSARNLIWLCRLTVAAILFQTLFFKFTAAPESIYIFTKVGMEPWGRITTGIFELIASILILIPSFSWLGAFIAIEIMIGAIFSHLTLLGIVVQDDSGLLFFIACTVFIASNIVLVGERFRLPLIGNFFELTEQFKTKFTAHLKQKMRLPLLIFFSLASVTFLGIILQVLSIENMLGAEPDPSAQTLRLAQISYFLTLGMIFISFLISILAIYFNGKPLIELTKLCQKVMEGDRSARSQLESTVLEFDILSHSMNSMLTEIETQEADIKEKALDIQRLLRVVIHDVANPLSVILAVSSIPEKTAATFSPDQKKAWDRISRASLKIQAIIQSTREFEAVRSGQKELELTTLKLSDCLASVFETFQDRISDKKIQVLTDTTLAPHEQTVKGNENLLIHSVLSNVISNAIKFSPEGGNIKLKIIKNEPKNIRVTVEDQGIGMPPEMREKFKRGHSLTSREGTSGEKGTGFGVDIARTFVRKMGGDLTIESFTESESPSNHGTSVHLDLVWASR